MAVDYSTVARGPVSARVDFWLDSAADVKSLIEEALFSGLQIADPQLFGEAMNGAPARRKVPSPVVVDPPPWGQPGAVCGSLLSSWAPTSGRAWVLRHRDGPITRRRMDWITAAERPLPEGVWASMSRLDDRGVPKGAGPDGRAETHDYSVRCSVLTTELGGADLPRRPGWAVTVKSRISGLDDEPRQERLDWVRDLASRPGVQFAEVGWMTDNTSFERVHGALGHDGHRIAQADRVLRGYNWITVVPAPPARQISAVRVRAASRDLHEVVELPNGTLWARGTERFQGYYVHQLRDMFLLCAEVLPDGPMLAHREVTPWWTEPTYPVIYEDAKDCRTP